MQMAIWAILAAPLIMSTDLIRIRTEFKAILLNNEIIAVNQDELGIQGLLVRNEQGIQVKTNTITFLFGEMEKSVWFIWKAFLCQ